MRLIDAEYLLYGMGMFSEKENGTEFMKGVDAVAKMIDDAPTIAQSGWIPCSERLPVNESKDVWEEYEVTVCESHYPTRSYDLCDAPYSKEIVTTALFDDEQKIWHICRSKEAINALLKEEDYPLNGDTVLAWKPMSEPYQEEA